MNKTQKGFAVLESLLILVIIAIIGGIGWYVWHSKSLTDKTLSNTSSMKTEPSINKEPAKNFLVIKEWDVKLPLSSVISDAYYLYQTTGQGTDEVSLSLNSLKGSGCGADQLPPARYSRVKNGSVTQTPSGSVTAPIDATAQLKGYSFYWSKGTTGACSVKNNQEQQAESAQAAFISALKNIQSE